MNLEFAKLIDIAKGVMDRSSGEAAAEYANARMLTISLLAAIAAHVTSGDYNIADSSPQIGVYGDIVNMVGALEEQIASARQESERAAKESENARGALLKVEESSNEARQKTETMLEAADKLEQVARWFPRPQASFPRKSSSRGAAQSNRPAWPPKPRRPWKR